VSLILRKINRSKWYKDSDPPWLLEGELQADVLGDLRTSSNALSVWHVESDRSNLERIAVAMVLQTKHLDHFDYALFDAQILTELNIQIVEAPGDTSDQEVNDRWHRDLIELSAGRLMELAQVIHSERTERKRILAKRIASYLADFIRAGHIDRAKLEQSQVDKLERYLPGWNRT